MKLNALIFDVDGTLAETEEAHREAFNLVFAENGLNWRWDRKLYGELLEVTGGKERLRHFVDKYTPQDAARFAADDALIAAMHKRKTQIYTDLVRTGEVPLRPGVERLIKQARAAGIQLAIATTTNRLPLQALFEGTLGLEALDGFDAVATGDMVVHKKPAPELYLLALEGLDLPAENCLALEDSRNGLVSAQAAGLETLITVNTYTQEQDFSGALGVVSDLGEPECAMRVLSGPAIDAAYIDIDILKTIFAAQGAGQ